MTCLVYLKLIPWDFNMSSPHCRFTAKLRDVYASIKHEGSVKFEVVLCSMDASKDKFDEQFSAMPWAALPFKAPQIEVMAKKFGVPSTL